MQLIIISGPSGSGKTTLSEIILKNIKDGLILKTDNYYRTGIVSKILSKSSPGFRGKISHRFCFFGVRPAFLHLFVSCFYFLSLSVFFPRIPLDDAMRAF